MDTLELRDELVTVKQFRKNGWLPEGHDGEFRYTHCFEELVPKNDTSGFPTTGLSQEEEAWFEKQLSLNPGTLSRYNKEYWGKYRVKISKEGLVLNLMNPKDYLTYKVLHAHQEVANSEVEKHDSPFANFVITSELQEAKSKAVEVGVKRKAWGLFAKMSNEDMMSFLKVFGKRPANNASTEWLESEIGKLIETKPEQFLLIMEDKSFKMKAFIDDCIAKKALTKSGSKYLLMGGDIIGYSIEDTIDYLSKPENQEVYIQLKSKLEV